MTNIISFLIELVVFFVKLTVASVRDFVGQFLRTHKDVKDKRIVITGGAQGLGFEAAKMLGGMYGAEIVLLDKQEAQLTKAVTALRESGISASGHVCDVTDPDRLRALALQLNKQQPVHCIVANAGIMITGSLNDLTDAECKRQIDINVLGVLWTVRAFLPAMKRRNAGHIVAISSMAGYLGEHKVAVYCASKFAVRGLMESIEYELYDHGCGNVNTTTIYPFFTRTALLDCCDPVSRFAPILEVEETAGYIVDSILKERPHGYTPTFIGPLCTIVKDIVFTKRVKFVIRDFLGIDFYASETKKQ